MAGEMPATEVLAVLGAFEEHGLAVWIDGGWGVDALLGRQTRPHADLDILLTRRDAGTAERLLRGRGYADVPRDDTRPCNFVLGDRQGHKVDFHVVTFDGAGNGIYGPQENGEFYPAHAFEAAGRIVDRAVRCLTLEFQLVNHTGYSVRAKDRQDVGALCRAFGRMPPPGFAAAWPLSPE